MMVGLMLIKLYAVSVIGCLLCLKARVGGHVIEEVFNEIEPDFLNPGFLRLCAILIPLVNTWLFVALACMLVSHHLYCSLIRVRWIMRKVKRKFK
jgi:hypothetical protein